MKIKINNVLKDLKIKESQTLSDMVSALQPDLKKEHQVITEIILNGEIVSLDEEKLKETKISTDDIIEITTSHLRDVTIQNTIESLRVLPKIKEDFKNISVNLKTGKDITTPLLESLKGLRWFNITLSSLEKILGIDFSQIKDGDTTLLDMTYNLVETLKLLLDALESQDSVRISDVIDYELSPLLDNFIKIVPEIIKELDRRIIH